MASTPAQPADEKSTIPAANADFEDVAPMYLQDKDVAMAIVGEHSHAIDPAVESRVVRKIDWFLVPAMAMGYGLVYYDKVD